MSDDERRPLHVLQISRSPRTLRGLHDRVCECMREYPGEGNVDRIDDCEIWIALNEAYELAREIWSS